MKSNYTPLFLAVSAAIISYTAASPASAQLDAVLEEVVVTGTRAPGRSAEDLPVPVDVLTAEAMANTGQTEVGRMLQSLAPSFNFSSSSISDGTDALRPATLRGLGPDQTLVLINGRRMQGDLELDTHFGALRQLGFVNGFHRFQINSVFT